jgi:hypothetical protein
MVFSPLKAGVDPPEECRRLRAMIFHPAQSVTEKPTAGPRAIVRPASAEAEAEEGFGTV